MKLASLCIILVSLQLTPAQYKSPGLKLMSATEQVGIRGYSRGGGSISYILKIKIRTTEPIIFKNLWLGDKYTPFDLQTFTLDVNKAYTKGDSILLVCRTDDTQALQANENKPIPINYLGAALVEYTLDGKIHYLIADKFEKKPTFKGE